MSVTWDSCSLELLCETRYRRVGKCLPNHPTFVPWVTSVTKARWASSLLTVWVEEVVYRLYELWRERWGRVDLPMQISDHVQARVVEFGFVTCELLELSQ